MTPAWATEISVWAFAYVVALTLSSPFVEWVLRLAGQAVPKDQINPGRVIGRVEDFLVVTFVIVDAFTALSIVFAAKSIVRAQRGRHQASYYVLGTLANLAWALGAALAARWVLSAI